MNIKLLGACCSGNCSLLEQNLFLALAELGWEPTVERVTDLASIIHYGCLKAPGLLVNGKLISQGNILSREQIKEILIDLTEQARDID